jgi:GNAT superfamily N-acetyltransferase
MPIDLLIREFRKSDIHIVLNLNKVAMEKIGVYKEGPDIENDLRNIKVHYFRNRGTFLVGTVNGIIVSMGAFRRLDKDTAEIKRMRTYPEYQGRGYGEKILTELILIARQYGYKNLILETSDKQVIARRLYSKLGFKEYKEEIIDGFNCTWYKLLLAY